MVVFRLWVLVVLQLVATTLGYQFISIGNNITFAYLDSGAVPTSSNYTTFVVVHGLGFNSVTFAKMMFWANQNNVRIVAVNRRDYAPTSPLTSAEMAVLSQGDTGAATYLRQRGTELASFLDMFVQGNSIPHAGNDRTGGIVVLGWSLGCLTTHAMLANLDVIPSATINRLQPYIHTFLMHDSGLAAMGFPTPPQHDLSLWFEPNAAIRFQLFKDWATGYFTHVDSTPATGTISTLEFNTPDPSIPRTLSDTPPGILQQILDQAAFGGYSENQVLFFTATACRNLMRRAIFDTTQASILPNVRVRYFYAGQTPGVLVLASWLITEANPADFGGVSARNIALHYADHGNHFSFYDYPDFTIQQFLAAVHV
jgi:hypothetical protein